MNSLNTGSNSWIRNDAADISSLVVLAQQIAGKKHIIDSIVIMTQANVVTISEGTNSTEERELFKIEVEGTVSNTIPIPLKRSLRLNPNKALLIKASGSNPVTYILEGRTEI